jgi:hypothetical protein
MNDGLPSDGNTEPRIITFDARGFAAYSNFRTTVGKMPPFW